MNSNLAMKWENNVKLECDSQVFHAISHLFSGLERYVFSRATLKMSIGFSVFH